MLSYFADTKSSQRKTHVLKDENSLGTVENEHERTFHYVTGQRGARKIVCRGFSYICAKVSGNRKYWVCAKQRSRNCKARLITDAEETFFVRRNQDHNHDREISIPASSATHIIR